MSDAHLSARAIVCTAHLMMLQNPKALITTNKDWMEYICLVRDWAKVQEIGGIKIYWHPGYSVEMPPPHNEDDEPSRKSN